MPAADPPSRRAGPSLTAVGEPDRGRIGGTSRSAVDPRAIRLLNSLRVGVDVADHRAEFLYWGYYDPRPWRNYLHTHSFFEVCYAYSGRGVFRTGPAEYDVGAGALFVARPGDVHEIVSSDDDPLCVHFWSYTLVPSRGDQPVGRDRAGGGRAGQDRARALLDGFAGMADQVVARDVGRVPDVLSLLAREAAVPGPAFDDLVSSLAAVLVIDTARAFVDDSELGPADLPDRSAANREEQAARTMVRYLQDNYARDVAARDVAAQVHLSVRHAARLFRAFTGTTMHAYLVRYRLEVAAQRLLERTTATADRGASIAEIARSCGYPDVRHFTTAFRRRWGVTPGVFRDGSGTAYLADPGGSEYVDARGYG
jgi:AraC-like DNA-binding protein